MVSTWLIYQKGPHLAKIEHQFHGTTELSVWYYKVWRSRLHSTDGCKHLSWNQGQRSVHSFARGRTWKSKGVPVLPVVLQVALSQTVYGEDVEFVPCKGTVVLYTKVDYLFSGFPSEEAMCPLVSRCPEGCIQLHKWPTCWQVWPTRHSRGRGEDPKSSKGLCYGGPCLTSHSQCLSILKRNVQGWFVLDIPPPVDISMSTFRRHQKKESVCTSFLSCPELHARVSYRTKQAITLLLHYTSGCVILQDGLVHWRNNGCVNVFAWGSWQSSKQKNRNNRKQQGSSGLACDPRTTSAVSKPSIVMDVDSIQGIATSMTATTIAITTTMWHENLDAAEVVSP